MITDINGGTLPPVVLGDDKFDTLYDVLLDGKTLEQVTDKQLIYLREKAITVQDRDQHSVCTQVLLARLTGKTGMVPDEEEA